MDSKVLASIAFEATVIEWRGPAPFMFAPVPDEHFGEIRYAAKLASYGWGVVPVQATIGTIGFTTSLFPRDDTYLLPLKVAVQKAAGITLGNRLSVKIVISARR